MEILAPCKNKENLIFAISSGASAVYLGLTDFSARKSADNFTFEDLAFAISYAKTFGAKVYLTVNTIIKECEIEPFINTIIKAYNMGVDAFILQDIFLGKYIKSIIPNICLHLSTQGGVSNVYGAKLAKDYGFSRVILARETKYEDIIKISKIIETEVFCQGALCTAFSGHCYFSSFIGGLSGNRGYCKQPCRKLCSYYTNNQKVTSGYSLSLADLNLSKKIDLLKKAGVSSLKIEGRMRSKEYVIASVKLYTEALNGNITKETNNALYKAYNRGDYTEGLFINQNKDFISNKIQGHKGLFVGKIKSLKNKVIYLDNNKTFNEGDSFKIIRNDYEVGNATTIIDGKKPSIIYKGDLKIGDSLYITKDVLLFNDFSKKLKDITVNVYLKSNENLVLECNGIKVVSDNVIDKAISKPTSKNDIISSLNKTDIYPYNVSVNFIYFDDNTYVLKSVINNLRAKLYYELFYNNPLIKCDNIANFTYNSNYKIKAYTKNNAITTSELLTINDNSIDIIFAPVDYNNFDALKVIKHYKNNNVFLYLPPFVSGSDLEIIDNYVKEFYGIFADGYYALDYAKENNLLLYVGTGFNVFNKVDLEYLSSYNNVYNICLSKELSFTEIKSLNDKLAVLNASTLQIMDLLYCPFSNNCEKCLYTNNTVLKDEDNREFKLVRYKLTSCRFKLYNMSSVYYEKLNAYNTVSDYSCFDKSTQNKLIFAKTYEEKSKLLGKTTVGNYLKGIK